ncbi:hypothetical protein IU453_01945 [Nocardia cyriacigeorgica]|uniref:hypothetical protein n=1 Tax=Nocardia cyriacigeorgica TaxID=135487 RepID=UPI001893CA8A|nr:hypothetical protein [Nocardia cyriacigeorgica]MBF6159180.1 hypothetical protein [Nocardia cyriacigeorgica]MBF6198263.1 hypothetical protein [Nocardia cyriacigeorgica]MBF6315543.1 hypothetical protein [Nocardia cyriacigeorgica]
MPEQVQQMLRGWADHLWDTGGLAFGTVSAAKGDQQLEITGDGSGRQSPPDRHPWPAEPARRVFGKQSPAERAPLATKPVKGSGANPRANGL